MDGEAFPVGNAELRAPFTEGFPSRVRAELEVVWVRALRFVPVARSIDQLRFSEISESKPLLLPEPSAIGSSLLLRRQQILDALEHVQRTAGGPGNGSARVAGVRLAVQVVCPVRRWRDVLSTLTEADSDAMPVALLVEPRNLGTTPQELGGHDPLGGNDKVLAGILDSLETAVGSPTTADDGPVPPNFSAHAPFREGDTAFRSEFGRPGGLEVRWFNRILGAVGLGGVSIIVLTPELVADTLEVRLELRRADQAGPELVGIREHSSDALHLALRKLGPLTLVAFPCYPPGFLIRELLRDITGHGEHEATLLVPLIRSWLFEPKTQETFPRSGTVEGDSVPLTVLR